MLCQLLLLMRGGKEDSSTTQEKVSGKYTYFFPHYCPFRNC